MYYVGRYFEEAKEYKTLDGAKKAAKKKGLNVYDEYAVQIYPELVEGPEEKEAVEEVETAADPEEKDTEKEGLNVYDEYAVQIYPELVEGPEEKEAAEEVETAADPEEKDTTKEISGKIRRVFAGKLRLRREPSFDPTAVCGVTKFTEKKVVKKITTKDGVLYQTTDGYYISGRPGDTEFIPE